MTAGCDPLIREHAFPFHNTGAHGEGAAAIPSITHFPHLLQGKFSPSASWQTGMNDRTRNEALVARISSAAPVL